MSARTRHSECRLSFRALVVGSWDSEGVPLFCPSFRVAALLDGEALTFLDFSTDRQAEARHTCPSAAAAGFLAVLTIPKRGIWRGFPGQVQQAVLNTAHARKPLLILS